MHTLYEEFITHLEGEDKWSCLNYALSKLRSGEVDVVSLYEQLLAPSLNKMECHEDQDTCIWKEHIRTSIVRSILESCYPFVIRERDYKYKGPVQKKAIVVCPTDEYHEMGARMVADFFALSGFTTVFIGANTPESVIVSAMRYHRPDYVAVSVTNYYHLFSVKRLISSIREAMPEGSKVVVGGSAFIGRHGAVEEVGADLHLRTFSDIMGLR